MFAKLFLLFTGMSLLEIFVFVKVGGVLGALPTVLLVIATALIGAQLVRSQGLQLIQQYQMRMAQGELPGRQLIEGLLLIISGVTLVTPGFVTDTLGLLLLQPKIRGVIATYLLQHMNVLQMMSFSGQSASGFQSSHSKLDDDVIEGEFERKDK